eukprot:scaffold201055_cov29-Tisochrysis_lutea.AAC.6
MGGSGGGSQCSDKVSKASTASKGGAQLRELQAPESCCRCWRSVFVTRGSRWRRGLSERRRSSLDGYTTKHARHAHCGSAIAMSSGHA